MTKDQMRSIEEALDLALEALEKLTDTEQTYEALDLGDKAITAIKQARALDKKADNAMIYKTFEQWMNGDFLEVGEPRKKAYSKDELLLVEMGWNYGYDAGRAVEQALDKKADNARELGLDYEPVQEPLFWYKPYPNGMYNGPVHNAQIGDVLRGSEEWRPLYTTPPAAQQDIQRLSALVRAQQITIDKLEAAQPAPVQSAERGEPVATKLETQQFNCFHVSAEDFQRLKALPVGAKLYTTPPAAQPAPVQEPAFYGFMDKENCCVHICYTPWAPRMTDGKLPTAFYTTAAQQQWVWLSKEDEQEIKDNCTTVACVLKAVKAKLKEKNT